MDKKLNKKNIEIEKFFEPLEEWLPKVDNEWIKIKDIPFYIYDGKKTKIIYNFDNNILDEAKKISNLLKDNDFKDKIIQNENNIIKMFKFTDGIITNYSYTSGSMNYVFKHTLCNYFEGKDTLINIFTDISKVKMELVDCYKGEHYRKYMPDIKDSLIAKEKVPDLFVIYKNILDMYVSNDLKEVEYNIYLFDNGDLKYLFSSEEEVNKDNINEYIEEFDLEYKKGNKIKLIEKINCRSYTQVMLKMDKYLYDKKMIGKSFNTYYNIIDPNFDASKISAVKKELFFNVQRFKIDNFLKDITDYSKVHKYIFEISYDNKKFVDISDADKSLKDNLEYIYSLGDKKIVKYTKLLPILRTVKFEDLKIKIIKKKTKNMKISLDVWLNDYIKKHDTIKNGLNYSDEEKKIVNKKSFIRFTKKKKVA
jgi:hypothetical protein